MPEGARRGSQRSPSNSAAKRPSSVSSLSGIVGRMMSSGERGASSSSCTSVNTVCSDGERPASLSLSSSASSVSLQDTSHSSSSSSSSSSLPYGAVPTYSASSSSLSSSTPKRNGSDISLDLTPLVTPHGGGRGGVARASGDPANRLAANQVAMEAATPRQLSRLERVVLEIVETEQTYVRDLKSIVEDYLGCIIDCGGALPLNPEQVSTLFCNIEDIYEFNSDLLEDLERSRDAASIAECFVERSEAFDIYTLYCMNYPNSVAILRDCMKNQSLVLFFQERRLTLSHSLPLETYLLKPVQRILKYHLLLQELSKHFDKSDPGYEVVEDAIITMTAVAWYINDMKRKQEHAVRLQEIESLLVNWTGPDLSGFGELVLEGSFKVQRVKKERAFFLFDKMLLIAKKRVELFVYSTHIFCCNLLLVENLKDPLCFRVSDQTIPKQQHVVQTKNQEEKRLWVHYLKRLIVENHPASLPQKARQVLGDTFCQTPQFNQDNLKKSTTPSRLDDLHGYHRGRRQSEPPELLLYTPEKSRKSLPLLLEGNLPYRRTRRQSAPAKDIEAAFHPNALKVAGSDGELCPADALGSAGSSSTLASSVIEVEAETPEPNAAPPPRPDREEEEREEEELPPLSPAPTLSITEEILEFINQSRARGGLFTADPEVQSSDRPQESDLPSDERNFTCPLPPAASSTPEQTPTMQQEQEAAETRLLQSAGSAEENRLEDETTAAAAAEETPAETSRVETGAEEDEEKRREEAEEEKQTREREEDESAPHLHPSISAEEEDEKKSCPSAENDSSSSSSSSQTPGVLQPVQRRRPPARGSHLTRRDKKIIEKIRSYYEAAAKAEEEEEEEEPEEEVGSRRRSSFSQIPSGLVKESVSRFDTSGHQGEPEGGQPKTEPAEGVHRDEESGFSSPLSEEPGNDGEAGKLVCSLLDVPAEGTREQDQETPDQEDLDLQVDPNGSVGAEAESEVCAGPPSGPGGLEEKQELETRVVDTGQQSPLREEGPPESSPSTNKDETSPGNPAVRNGPESEPKGRHEEPPTGQKPEARPQSSWNRSKHRDLAKTSKNLDGLPSQIKVGRWSHHSRIVTANRALFESMGSDVARIGLFETSPVVDPMLVENSERILSKVQTLAQMYSAKASTMKVPLHQKRAAATVRTPAWVSAKPSSPPAGTQTRSPDQGQVQNSTEHRQVHNNPSDTLRETKTGTQTLEAKVQSQTRQIWIQTTGQEDESIQEKTVKRAESQTADLQQRATVPCQPQLFGPAVVKEPLTPTNGFTLSRPRDFISALTRDTVDDPQTPTTAKESPPPRQDQVLGSGSETADASSGSAASGRQLRTQAEGPSSTWSVGSEEDLDQDLDVFPDPEGTRVRDRLELTGGCPVSSVIVAQSTQQSEEQVKCSLDASQQALREPEELSTKGVDTVHVGPGPPGELVLIVASIPSRAPTEDHKSEPGLAGDQTATLGTSGELKNNGNYSVQQGSTVIFTDEPAAYRHSGGLAATLDLSTGPTTLTRENPWSWVPSSEPSLSQPSRPLVASTDVLPTFTNQRPTDLVSTAGKRAPSNTRSVTSSNQQRNVREPDQQGSWSSTSPPVSSLPSGHAYSEAPNLVDRTDLMMPIPGRDSASSAFEHGQQRCPSPVRTLHFPSSTQTPSGTSSLRTVPSPTPTPAEDISTNTLSRVLPRLSPTLSSGSVSSVQSPPSSSPTPSSACVSSSSCRSSSLRAGPPSSTSPSSVRSPPCSSPITSSSAFTRSLAASCISQSISHSLARKTTASQQGPPLNTPVNQSQSTHLRRRSPSPKLLAQNQQGSSALAPTQQGGTKDGYQRQKCPASSPWSSCPSPRLSEHSSSPSMSLGRHSTPPSPRPSFLHSRSDTSQNLNNNNNNSGINKSSTCGVNHTLGNGACLVNPHKATLANSSIAVTHDPLWSGSHNRVARPFSASEPSSRVQSPSPSPTPASFSRLCSPPPQHNHSSPMANKPPHPRSSRSASATSHNPLGLTLELPRASSASTALGQSCLSPRILSPPPIGVSVNVWTNNVAMPQPRNPRCASSSLGSPSLDSLFQSSSYSSIPLRSSRATSPSSPSPLSSQTTTQTLRRSFSTTLAEVPPSPTESGVRRSWVDSSHSTLGFTANGQRSFVKQESCPTSPRSGWSSYGNSPPCLSPRAGLQSPISPGRLTPGKGTLGGQHFTSVPWPDVRELSTKYNGTDGLDSGADSTIMDSPSSPSSLPYTLLSSPAPSGDQTEWGDPELEEGSCRSQLICAYVARPPQEQNLSSSSVTSPPFVIYQNHNYQTQVTSQPQVQSSTTAAPVPSTPYPFPLNPSPNKQGNQKTSYATTVNLKIAGSGRITSFSTAQVSLTQTLQGGAGGPGQVARRVSINGLSQIPSPLPQN